MKLSRNRSAGDAPPCRRLCQARAVVRLQEWLSLILPLLNPHPFIDGKFASVLQGGAVCWMRDSVVFA
jgi:hypothetical protein